MITKTQLLISDLKNITKINQELQTYFFLSSIHTHCMQSVSLVTYVTVALEEDEKADLKALRKLTGNWSLWETLGGPLT